MNSEVKDLVVACSMSVVVGICFGVVIGSVSKQSDMRDEAIQHGYAEYNATNGAWQWRKLEIVHYHDTDYAYPRELDNYNSNYMRDEKPGIHNLPAPVWHYYTNIDGQMWYREVTNK